MQVVTAVHSAERAKDLVPLISNFLLSSTFETSGATCKVPLYPAYRRYDCAGSDLWLVCPVSCLLTVAKKWTEQVMIRMRPRIRRVKAISTLVALWLWQPLSLPLWMSFHRWALFCLCLVLPWAELSNKRLNSGFSTPPLCSMAGPT